MIMTTIPKSYTQEALDEALQAFQQRSQLTLTDEHYEIKERTNEKWLLIYLSNPTNRFFKLLNEASENLSEENPYKERTILKKRSTSTSDRIHLPETQLLRTILSESLTVTQYSFQEDFFTRYIRSVSGAEQQIIARGNHIVYGRRGAGKSSLLAYLMNTLRQQQSPYAWVTMQTYSGRSDIDVVTSVLLDIIDQIKKYKIALDELDTIYRKLESLSDIENEQNVENQLNRLFPKIRKALASIADKHESIFIFLDDLHVIEQALQPRLLSKLYAICRDNRTFLKISGIEQFVKLWEHSSRQGLETPHDIQVIQLDYNLTMPDKAHKHIVSILDAHAVYCGLPNVGYICGNGVLDRLVWVAAGVPRDALNIFAQAIAYSDGKDQKKVSITSINNAASKMADDKLKDIKQDASGKYDEVSNLLEKIRRFCVKEKRNNAFLIEIKNENPIFTQIQELIALRLLHILNEGFTPGEVGRRYMALMLDYGFYVGMRAAKSVDLFSKEPKQLQAQELRKLPRMPL
jgi:Cdc6-like AAA superfamily ATPase